METRQLTHVTDTSDKFFLSREACIALDIISPSFPTIGEALETQSSTSTDMAHKLSHIKGDTMDDSGLTSLCHCPRCQLPPTLPTQLPFPASETNREKLQQFLLDFYSSSTFNICNHQLLPLMDGPPLKLMVDPEAKPVAHHTPVPIPLNWC